jgi:hypothetical protein
MRKENDMGLESQREPRIASHEEMRADIAGLSERVALVESRYDELLRGLDVLEEHIKRLRGLTQQAGKDAAPRH